MPTAKTSSSVAIMPQSLWRYIGILVTLALAFSVTILPFVGSSTLAMSVFLRLQETLASSRYPSPATFVSAVGFLLIVVGLVLGLMFFGFRSSARKTRAGLVLCAVGLLLVTTSMFDYHGDFMSQIPALYGIGYLVSWLAVIVGLIAAGRAGSQASTSSWVAVQPEQVVENLVPTGYTALDNMLYGGVSPGTSIVLTGPPCDEKNLIVRRFIKSNLDSGRGCIYISSSIDRARDLLSRHGRDLQVVLCHPQADIIAAEFPAVTKLKSMDNLTEINLAFTKALAQLSSHKSSVLCLEILDDVLLDHHNATRRWLMDILGRSKSYHITSLATLNPTMHSAGESQAALETFDGHIDLYEADLHVHPKLIRVKKLGGRRFLDNELLVEREKI
jgi:KaiC/GvpD/RAD55 family RecA-like ATPase